MIFSFGQCNVWGSDSPNFRTYLSIQNVYANYNILGTLKNLVLNRFSQCSFCRSDSPNFCTYLSIQNVYAYYNILGTKKNFVLNRFGQCIFCSLDSLNFRTYLSIQNIYANYNILFWWICLPYFRLYAIRTCITLIMFVWILAHSCFRVLGTMLGTFLVNKPVLH